MGKRVRHAFAGSTRQIRLRPDEGLVPQPDERGLRHRDRSGQKLRDTHDKNGFCTGVTGPMESDGHRIRAAKPTSGAGPAMPELDTATGHWYVGEQRLVVRTTDTPDGPLVRSRLVPPDSAEYETAPTFEKIKRTPKVKAVKPAGDDSAQRGNRRRGPRFTDKEILDFIRHKFGVSGKVTLTREVRTAAIAAMTKAATVAEYSEDLRNAGQSGVAKRRRV